MKEMTREELQELHRRLRTYNYTDDGLAEFLNEQLGCHIEIVEPTQSLLAAAKNATRYTEPHPSRECYLVLKTRFEDLVAATARAEDMLGDGGQR